MTDRPEAAADRREALQEVRRLADRNPPLDPAALADLLGAAAGGDDQALERLVAHHLWVVRDAVLARPQAQVPVADLLQEGSAGLVIGLQRHIADRAPPDRLAEALQRSVAREIDAAEALEQDARAEEARWIADSDLFAAAAARLRRERDHEPTTGELAMLLSWEEERVDRVREMVTRAQAAHDVDLLTILAEVEGDVGAGEDGTG